VHRGPWKLGGEECSVTAVTYLARTCRCWVASRERTPPKLAHPHQIRRPPTPAPLPPGARGGRAPARERHQPGRGGD
jgi:hypothetical protein